MRSRMRSAHRSRSAGGIQDGTRSSMTPSTSRAETVLRRRGEATTRTGVRPFPEPPSRSPVVMRPYAYHLRSAARAPGTHLSARRPPGRATVRHEAEIYTRGGRYILEQVAKHLVDIDDDALQSARAELKTETIRDTVNEALRRAGAARGPRVKRALDTLAGADLRSREEAWR